VAAVRVEETLVALLLLPLIVVVVVGVVVETIPHKAVEMGHPAS